MPRRHRAREAGPHPSTIKVAFFPPELEGRNLDPSGRQEAGFPAIPRVVPATSAPAGRAARVHAAAADLLAQAPTHDRRIDLNAAGVRRPGATWTYLVTDDHFGSEWNRIGSALKRTITGREGV